VDQDHQLVGLDRSATFPAAMAATLSRFAATTASGIAAAVEGVPEASRGAGGSSWQ
jgi:hypothetical protein